MNTRWQLLSHYGYRPDPGSLERSPGGCVLYHYTRRERLEQVFAADSGLHARLPVLASELTPEFKDCYVVEGLLNPLPHWLTASPYFGSVGIEMFKEYIGDVLLQIELPLGIADVYVADYAHILECKHLDRRGMASLNLGYDCRTGHEAIRAYVHSYIPALDYAGGHIAPVVQVVRKGEGIAIPCKYIRIADIQPLSV